MTEEEKKQEKVDALKILFPERRVKLAENIDVVVTPISLKEMPKISNAFGKVMRLAAQGVTFAEISTIALTELMELIPYCIDLPPESIPQWAIPDIIDIVLEQNATDNIVGKWEALILKLTEKFQGAQVNQSEK